VRGEGEGADNQVVDFLALEDLDGVEEQKRRLACSRGSQVALCAA
jgi:hypothetical protein